MSRPLNEEELLSLGMSRATVAVLRDAVEKTQSTQVTLSTGEIEAVLFSLDERGAEINELRRTVEEQAAQLLGLDQPNTSYLEQQNEALQYLIMSVPDYSAQIGELNSKVKQLEEMVF